MLVKRSQNADVSENHESTRKDISAKHHCYVVGNLRSVRGMVILAVENVRGEFVTTPVYGGPSGEEDRNNPCAKHHNEATEVGEGFVHRKHHGHVLVNGQTADRENAGHSEESVDKTIKITEGFANSLKKKVIKCDLLML